MATLKQRLHRKNASGQYDLVYFETSADLIIGDIKDDQIERLTASKAYYINSETGSDTNTGLTASTAFKTINAALALIPRNMNKFFITIYCTGEFTEDLKVAGYIGNGYPSAIRFMKYGDTNFTLTGTITLYSTSVYISGMDLIGSISLNYSYLLFEKSNISGVSDNGITTYMSIASINSVSISDKTSYGIYAFSSIAYIYNISGSNPEAVGILAGSPNNGHSGIAIVKSCKMTAKILYYAKYGGILFVDGSLYGFTASRALVTDTNGIITESAVTSTELGYLDGVTSNIQTQLNGKQASITGGASTIAATNLTASRALVSNSSGKVAVSTVTATELGYLDGVTSNVQTQLNGKSATSHNHNGTYIRISDSSTQPTNQSTGDLWLESLD